MFSDELPVAIYTGSPPQYINDGLAINCALVLHVLRGTARIRCNFELIEEQTGSVVLFNPGDVVKVEQRSADFEVEILAFSSFIRQAVLNQLDNVSAGTFRKNIINAPKVSSAARGMEKLLSAAVGTCSVRELYFISVMQLRAFYLLFQVMLRHHNMESVHSEIAAMKSSSASENYWASITERLAL